MRAGALVVLALTLGAAKAEPIILIDHEWNVPAGDWFSNISTIIVAFIL